MCGIAGILQSPLRYGTVHLQRMTDALAHRGPDGAGNWSTADQQVMLGHRRLAILDLSEKAAQPMLFPFATSEKSIAKYSIVHNGEIYNYIELRKELSNEGYQFYTDSDTEVILAAYDFWQDDCVLHFDGMFSFAIWDDELKELFAARDRFGEKPFFYFKDKQQFLFASEMKALWAAGVPREPNARMLFNYITIGYTDNPSKPSETFFDGISKLPAAHRLFYSLREHTLDIEQYWDIDTQNIDKKINEEEAQEKFRSLFSASVKRRLRSDVKVGASLSGGLDSSSIMAMVSEHIPAGHPFTCYTAGFPGFQKDESVLATLVAEKFHWQHILVEPTSNDLVSDWQKMQRAQEEPIGSASVFAQYKIYEAAARNGTTVLLDGQGADEVLAGYSKYFKWYWQELFLKRKLIRSQEISKARNLGVNESFGVRNVMAALFPELASVLLERQYLLNALKHEDLHPEFVKLQSRDAYYTAPEIRGLNDLLYFNTMIHGLEELLRYADRNSMAFGREVRLPFLDHKLVEFIFSLPASFKIKEGWTKWLLRSSMESRLPESIVWRKDKVGFEPPQQDWMKDARMQEMLIESKRILVKEKIIQEKSLQNLQPSSSYDQSAYNWRYLSAADLYV